MPDAPPRPTFAIEAIVAVPAPGMAMPNAFSFSQDDTQVTYLLGTPEQPAQQLYALDTATGAQSLLVAPPGGGLREEGLSPAEELRRQRERSLATGLTRYSRAERAEHLLIPVGDDLYVLDRPGAPLRLVVEGADALPILASALSPDGSQIAFVRDAELYVVSTDGGVASPRQLTFGARGTGTTHGLAEYIAQEELDRSEGFWWAPDGRQIAFAEVDETHIPIYRIAHLGDDATADAYELHRYPFAGAANARVRLAVVAAEGSAPVWMDLDTGEECYLARVFWWRDGSLGAALLNHAQTALDLVRFDAATGARTLVLREVTQPWVNVAEKPLVMLADGGFVWTSERSGFRHLYLYTGSSALVRQLTAGEWMVDALVAVDERRRLAYFTGTRETPLESHLYAVSLEGGDVRRITSEPGMHAVTLDHACRRFVDVRSATDTPPVATLRALEDGALLYPIAVPADPRLADFQLAPPELVTLPGRDGTPLYGALYRPPAAFGPGPYPTIIHVYGGPHAQLVTNSWGRLTAALDLQYLRQLGYLIFRLDNRGSARRGLAFEAALDRRMGTVEVEDQVDGVRWLVAQGLSDLARIGVLGWSYGGYMALMCLAKAPEVFKVGVAGAPVTAWDGYDTAYTERYMGTPAENPNGYAEGSVLHHAAGIRGKLLLVHGMLDENVHFRHSARLMNALIRSRVPYDTLFFPDERHMPRHPAGRVYLNERIIGYFQQHLSS